MVAESELATTCVAWTKPTVRFPVCSATEILDTTTALKRWFSYAMNSPNHAASPEHSARRVSMKSTWALLS